MPEVTGSSPVSSTINRGRELTICSFAREPPMKVSVFFDGQNFYRSLQRYDESLRVDYDRLAAWITQAVGGPGAIFAGAHYYVGVSADAPPLVEGFLKGLEPRSGGPGRSGAPRPAWRPGGWRVPRRSRPRAWRSSGRCRSCSAPRRACRT